MLDRLRRRMDSIFLSLGRAFSRITRNPMAWTSVGLLISVIAGSAYHAGGYLAGVFGGLFVLISGFLDIVDGAVARVTGKVSKTGNFLDSTLDRLGEVAIFVGVLLGGFAAPWLVIVALSFSLLVSYTRAKADSLGVALAGVGIGERSERLLVLTVASLLGLVQYGVAIIAILAVVTFAERLIRTTSSLRKTT